MTNTHIGLAKIVVLGMLVQLMVIGYIFVASHSTSDTIVNAARAGCERNKRDRRANAEGWRIAQSARWASGDFAVSRRYGKLASQLESRSRLNCKKTYPKARLLP